MPHYTRPDTWGPIGARDYGEGSRCYPPAIKSEERKEEAVEQLPSDSDPQGWLELCQRKGWLHLEYKEKGWLAFKMGMQASLFLLALDGSGEKLEYDIDKETNPQIYQYLSSWMLGARYQEKFNQAVYVLFE